MIVGHFSDVKTQRLKTETLPTVSPGTHHFPVNLREDKVCTEAGYLRGFCSSSSSQVGGRIRRT